jgi:hypothetical protein
LAFLIFGPASKSGAESVLQQIGEFAVPEANQGVGVDAKHFYAVDTAICQGATPDLQDLTMSYFSVDGLVSGIKSHMIEAPSKATAAILRNVVVWPKLAAIRPKTAVLRAAPIPDAVPMMP